MKIKYTWPGDKENHIVVESPIVPRQGEHVVIDVDELSKRHGGVVESVLWLYHSKLASPAVEIALIPYSSGPKQ